jgi:hypothetical protein
MVVLQGFVDDSTSDVGDRRMFLAAYINGADQWASFANAWTEELRRDSLDYFKMVEAKGLRGQFAGWDPVLRDRKVAALAGLIAASRPWFVYCSVSRAEYGEILAPVAPAGLKTPYLGCFWGVIKTTARYHRSLGIDGIPPVDFTFDEQGGLGDDAAMFYRWLKESEDPEIRSLLGSTPVFGDDKTTPPLQAADMLAWHLRKDHETNGADRARFHVLTDQGCGVHLRPEELRDLAKKMARVPGVGRVQTKAEWKKIKRETARRVAAGEGPPRTDMAWMRYIAARAWLERLRGRWRRLLSEFRRR